MIARFRAENALVEGHEEIVQTEMQHVNSQMPGHQLSNT